MRTEPRESLEPRCAFCGTAIERPAELRVSAVEKAHGGRCSCGALYLVDPTGKGLGEVKSQALGMVAEALQKDMWDLAPEMDYVDAIMRYDVRTHQSGGLDRGLPDKYGRLYFIKAHKKTD